MARCPLAKCGGQLETVMDGIGRVTVFCPRCERRRAHRCVDCGRPVTQGKTWRCPLHLRLAKRRNDKACRLRDPEKEKAEWRARWKKMSAEEKERRKVKRRAWGRTEAGRRSKQRYNDQHRIGYLAYQRIYNRKRRAAKLAYMKRYNTGKPRPCEACGVLVPWSGKGRPAKWCDEHRPWPRRQRRAVAA